MKMKIALRHRHQSCSVLPYGTQIVSYLHYYQYRYQYCCRDYTITPSTSSLVKTPVFNSVLSLQRAYHTFQKIPSRIVFGSCSSQNGDLSYWDRMVDVRPDLIILMGDNVYPPLHNKEHHSAGSAIKESTMTSAYQTLGSNPSFIRAVNSTVPIIATLDDNDYNMRYYQRGTNLHQPIMTPDEIHRGLESAKHDFLRFFRVDLTDLRWTKDGRGVYTSYDFYLYEDGSVNVRCSTNHANDSSNKTNSNTDTSMGKIVWRLQIILLDVRRHKSPFTLQDTFNCNDEKCTGPYIPSHDKNKTMLGACQWKWLEEQLMYETPSSSSTISTKSICHNYDINSWNQEPNLRVIVSPIQVLSDGLHGWDCWSLFPHERERLLSLLVHQSFSTSDDELSNKNIPTILLSGDRHVAGFYKQDIMIKRKHDTNKHNIFEVTSSSLTHTVPNGLLEHEIDTKRVGDFIYGNNFGILQLKQNGMTTVAHDGTKEDATVTAAIHCATTGRQLDCTTIHF